MILGEGNMRELENVYHCRVHDELTSFEVVRELLHEFVRGSQELSFGLFLVDHNFTRHFIESGAVPDWAAGTGTVNRLVLSN